MTIPIPCTLAQALRKLRTIFPLKVNDEGHAFVAEALIKRRGGVLLVYDEEAQQLTEMEAGELSMTDFTEAFNAEQNDE